MITTDLIIGTTLIVLGVNGVTISLLHLHRIHTRYSLMERLATGGDHAHPRDEEEEE